MTTGLLDTHPQRTNKSGYYIAWESVQFEDVPLIQCIVNLKMIELNIKSAELIAIEYAKDKQDTLANKPQ